MRSSRELAGGVALLLVIAALALMATSNAFAFSTATDQQSTAANGGPMNQPGVVSLLTLNVTSAETVITSYTFPSTNTTTGNTAQGIGSSAATSIRTMYQQWRHPAQNDWFYLYAQNTSTSSTTPIWDYYYYTPARGYTRINRVTSLSNGNATVASGGLQLNASFVYLTSGTGVPAFAVDSVTANTAAGCGVNVPVGGTCSGATFSTTLHWGVAQQGFRDEGNAGTILLQSAVESFPIATATTPSLVVYYDAWEPVTQSDANSTVTLGDNAATQAASGVTNASGARNVNTASSYQSIQTINDVDGDLSGGSLIWVFSSGTEAGRWFQTGVYFQRTTGGDQIAFNSATGNPLHSVFYQSWNEAVTYTTSGAQITTNYFTTLNVSATGTSADRGNGQGGLVNSMITYNYIYSASARGSVTLWGRAEDWHGRSSGNVQVGTQTIS
jgi:hypothetical protein